MPQWIVAALVVLALSCPSAQAQVGAGDAAPPITLESISNAPDGLESVSWEDYGDRVVLLEFWGTWCGPCVAAIPHLNEVADELKGNDGVAFLSVTFEDTDVIGPFLEKQPMRSVIGHDTDRSMPEAFGVRGWPTTFIVKNGTVLYRGYPGGVSADLLAALAEDDADPEKLAKRFPALLPRKEAVRRGSGSGDPWSAAMDADVQVMLGKAGPDASQGMSSGRGTSGVSIASDSVTLAGLISAVWDAPPYRISLAEGIDGEERYKVVFKSPNDKVDAARAFLAASLGVRVERTPQVVQGYRVTPAEGGVTLAEPIGSGSSMQTGHKPGEFIHISGPRMSVGGFFEAAQAHLGKPIVLPEGLGEREFRCDIELPLDDERAAIETLRETLGVELVPDRVEIEVLRVSPVSDG
jgi:thiol-disulfide isomerase/thioredoxin